MGWFPNILHGLQSTNPTKMMHILPTKDMPYFLENPKYAEIISDHIYIYILDLFSQKLSPT